MPSKLPWDQVKAESLRSICVDLGRRLSTKADMISFLRTVEDEGRTSYISFFFSIISVRYADLFYSDGLHNFTSGCCFGI